MFGGVSCNNSVEGRMMFSWVVVNKDCTSGALTEKRVPDVEN